MNVVANIDGVGARSGSGSTHGSIVHSVGDSGAVRITSFKDSREAYIAITHESACCEICGLGIKSLYGGAGTKRIFPGHEMVTGVCHSVEAHGVASDVLVGARSRVGGAHGGIIDSESYGQSVRHVSAFIELYIVNHQHILVGAVVVTEGYIDVLTCVCGEVNIFNFSIAIGDGPFVHHGEAGGVVVGGCGNIYTIVFSWVAGCGCHSPLHGHRATGVAVQFRADEPVVGVQSSVGAIVVRV